MISTVVRYAKARKRPTKGAMNRTEQAYADHLEMRRLAGGIVSWGFEKYKLRLAKATFFDPDFFVINSEHELEFHEVKGHWEDDARVKIKVVAEQFPQHRFVAIKREKGAWKEEEF